MYIFVTDEELKSALAILRASRNSDAAGLANCLESDRNKQNHPDRNKYIEAARKLYLSDDLDVDENPLVSIQDEFGAYVMMWRWITNEEAGVEPEET